MRILFDLCHPAHVHFFAHPITMLKERGHDILVTSREKEVAHDLLNELGIKHKPLTAGPPGNGILALGKELLLRDFALVKTVLDFKPDVMTGIGGIFIAHAGFLTRTPSLVFYDTENATLQNGLTYPFASCVIAPECYGAWLPKKRTLRYAGYHELSYLRPNRFTPDKKIAIENGLDEAKDNYLIRTVAWQASHDIGEKGWTLDLLSKVVERLEKSGNVIILSESELPENLDKFRYQGKPSLLHHVMAFCRLFVGESATMASESAILGVPAIYAAETGRGYTDEQEKKFGLVRNLPEFGWEILSCAIDETLTAAPEKWSLARSKLLAETIDVAEYTTDLIERWPAPLTPDNSCAE